MTKRYGLLRIWCVILCMNLTQVIKFVDEVQIAEITAVDRGILELKTAVENLHTQVDSIQRKMDELVLSLPFRFNFYLIGIYV